MTSLSFGDGFAQVALLPRPRAGALLRGSTPAQNQPWSLGTDPSALEVLGGEMWRPELCCQSSFMLPKQNQAEADFLPWPTRSRTVT